METHNELTGYIRCGDMQELVAGIVALCAGEGLRRVVDPPIPVLAPVASREGLFSVAVLPGVGGWQVLICQPDGFFCERPVGAAQARFVGLCDRLRAPGMLREVCGGDAVVGHGDVMLEADGNGNHALAGFMWRTEYEDADPAENLHLTWFGHQLDEDDMHYGGFRLIGNALPEAWSEDVTRWHSDISVAMACGHAAHHLAGPETSRYWSPEGAWHLVWRALAIGGDLPVSGGVILTFAPAGLPMPASAALPAAAAAPRDDLPGFRYYDGTPIRRGDEVRRSNGNTGVVVGMLVRNGTAGEEPGGVSIDGIDGSFVVEPAWFHTLQLVRRGAEPSATPSWEELERRVALNDADAQYAVGLIHKKGDGTARDALRAATWFRKAAEQGHAAAQYELGYAHYLANGVPEDWRELLRWMEAAAAQGQQDALRFLVSRLGKTHRLNFYRERIGLGSDMPGVVALLERLADRDNEGARFELGQLYASGDGVPRDVARAIHWYRLAAAQGHPDSAKRLAELLDSDGGSV